jgi:hypothetical protein
VDGPPCITALGGAWDAGAALIDAAVAVVVEGVVAELGARRGLRPVDAGYVRTDETAVEHRVFIEGGGVGGFGLRRRRIGGAPEGEESADGEASELAHGGVLRCPPTRGASQTSHTERTTVPQSP